MSKQILVTGGCGYIGSHTCLELLKQGYEVIVVDNLYNSKIESLERVKLLTGKDIKFYQGNILDYNFLDKIFIENDIFGVIHLASLKSVGESSIVPLNYYKNNITGTICLLEVMKKYHVKNIIFSSSATVYGEQEIQPIKETAVLKEPTNPYGKTKLYIESILKDLYNSDKEWNIILLRYFNPIGAHESGLIGEDPNDNPKNLMSYITEVAIGKRQELTIYGNDYNTYDGTGVRDYIHVCDLARGILSALTYLEKSNGLDIFNLGTGTGYSVLDLIKTFSKVLGRELPYKIVERRIGDVATCYADSTHAYKILGFKCEKTLEDMCRDSWNWQSKNPNGYK